MTMIPVFRYLWRIAASFWKRKRQAVFSFNMWWYSGICNKKKGACVILINQGCKQIIWLSYILPSQKGAATHTVYTRQTRPNWAPIFSTGYWTWTKISGRKQCRVKVFLHTKQKKGTHDIECPKQETQDNLHKNAWKALPANEKQTNVFYAKF